VSKRNELVFDVFKHGATQRTGAGLSDNLQAKKTSGVVEIIIQMNAVAACSPCAIAFVERLMYMLELKLLFHLFGEVVKMCDFVLHG
jgi:hypothetical protein